jgi:hypothetical protein
MNTHATYHPPGIGTVLVAAVAAIQVVALAVLVARDIELDQRVEREQAAVPVMLPEIVVSAPRIGS